MKVVAVVVETGVWPADIPRFLPATKRCPGLFLLILPAQPQRFATQMVFLETDAFCEADTSLVSRHSLSVLLSLRSDRNNQLYTFLHFTPGSL